MITAAGIFRSVVRIMLLPFVPVYGAVVALRNKAFDLGLFKTYQSSLPVVSVGNFTVGGSGKTPFVRYLAQYYLNRGVKPVILSRGYGGSCRGPYLVQENDSADIVGDEPLMQKRFFGSQVSVVIARRRVAGAKFIEEHSLGGLIILDDGFQHRWLARDLNILLLGQELVNGETIAAAERLLPVGRLRESVASALRRADALVVVRRVTGKDTGEDFGKGSRLEVVPGMASSNLLSGEFRLYPLQIKNIFTAAEIPLEEMQETFSEGVVAFSGIAKPESFFAMLKALGLKHVDTVAFPDHHLFTVEELAELESRQLPLICTEKDAVKVTSVDGCNGSNIYYLGLNADFSANTSFFEALTITRG
ncbi:MAG: tetraacyldisaccharide 4'-kinase [bacterium]|nr:tetraacyldisaccharide 4'-kinase [bacterium]